MKVHKTELDGVLIIEPKIFDDKRGYFFETYQRQRYADAGIRVDFVQDNLSFSKKGTLRGLHYQHPHDQAKLVQVIHGEVFDVAVDLRRESPTFGKWIGQYISGENKKQVFISEGFAHGFISLHVQRLLCIHSIWSLFQSTGSRGHWSNAVYSRKIGQIMHDIN